ncbi:MAG: TMEM175 family protein [Pseudomonadota bacterium]
MDDRSDLRISKNRLEALVDGIFAFAMTLLVTGLVIPNLSKTEAEATLAIRIAEMRSEFISFLVAFFVLASFWRRHHWQLHYVGKVDSGIMRITLFILACVVLMPFTTNISGDYSDVQVAVDLFHVNMFSIGLFFLIHWWYLTRNPDITSIAISRRDASNGMCGALVTPVISALGFVLSFFSPSWSMATYLLIMPCLAIVRKYCQ